MQAHTGEEQKRKKEVIFVRVLRAIKRHRENDGEKRTIDHRKSSCLCLDYVRFLQLHSFNIAMAATRKLQGELCLIPRLFFAATRTIKFSEMHKVFPWPKERANCCFSSINYSSKWIWVTLSCSYNRITWCWLNVRRKKVKSMHSVTLDMLLDATNARLVLGVSFQVKLTVV